MIARMSKYDLVLYAGQSSDFIEKLRGLGLVDITTTGWEPSDEDRQLLLTIDNHHKAVETLKRFLEDERFVQGPSSPIARRRRGFRPLHGRYAAGSGAPFGDRTLAENRRRAASLGRFFGRYASQVSGQGRGCCAISSPAVPAYEKDIEAWSERYTIALVHEGETFDYFVVVTRPGEEVVARCAGGQGADDGLSSGRSPDRRGSQEARGAGSGIFPCGSFGGGDPPAWDRAQAEVGRDSRENTAQPEADGTLVILEGWAEESDSAKVDALLAEYPNLIFLKSTRPPRTIPR